MLRQGNQSLSLPSKFGFITQFTNKLTQCLLTDYVSRCQPNLCDTKKIQWQQATDTNTQTYTHRHTQTHTLWCAGHSCTLGFSPRPVDPSAPYQTLQLLCPGAVFLVPCS